MDLVSKSDWAALVAAVIIIGTMGAILWFSWYMA